VTKNIEGIMQQVNRSLFGLPTKYKTTREKTKARSSRFEARVKSPWQKQSRSLDHGIAESLVVETWILPSLLARLSRKNMISSANPPL
jgi:hypothetical protein